MDERSFSFQENDELFEKYINCRDFVGFENLFKQGYRCNSVTLFEKAYAHSADWAVLWIQNGFDINQNYGCLLHRACEKLHVDFAIFLLENGADPYLRQDYSNTIFEEAAGYHGYLENHQKRGQERLCRYLLQMGLNPITESRREPSILRYLLCDHSEDFALEVIDWLAEHDCLNVPSTHPDYTESKHLPVSYALPRDERKYNSIVLRYFIQKGACLNAEGITSEKLFIQACRICGLEELKLVVSAGANVHETEYEGTNALFAAVQYGRGLEIISYLVELGLDVNNLKKARMRDNDVLKAESVLEVAERLCGIETVDYLLSHGAVRSRNLLDSNIEDNSIGNVECVIEDNILISCRLRNRCTVELPQGITKIAENAFFYSQVEVVRIPEGVTCIERQAFVKCQLLRKIILPSTVRIIDFCNDQSFPSLCEFEVAEDNPLFCTQDGVLFDKGKNVLIRCPARINTTVYIVPDTVTHIAKGAFSGCSSIREIVLPSHRIYFGDFCFKDCTALKKINLPDDLEEIPYGMFLGSGIEKIEIPEKVRMIGSCAFRLSQLKSFSVPPRLEEIGNDAFNPCNLQDIVIPATINKVVREQVFSDCAVFYTVIFPEKSYLVFDKDYKAMEAFSRFYIGLLDKSNDSIFLDALNKKIILKRHLIHIAMTRLFKDCERLSEEAKQVYEGIVKGNRKNGIMILAKEKNVRFLRNMIAYKYATLKDIKKIVSECMDEDDAANLMSAIM